jgi:hypothetical protein
MSRTDALEAAARALQGQSDSLKHMMGPGSLGVPLPMGMAPAAMLAPLESPGWPQTLVRLYGCGCFEKVRVGGGSTPQATHSTKKMLAARPLPVAVLQCMSMLS